MRRRTFITGLCGAALAPCATRAQTTMPVIGYLSSNRPEAVARNMTAFRQGLAEMGFVEGRNVAIEYRWAEGQNDRLPALAADLVRRNVAVIATNGNAALAAKAATATIPIVFESGTDPVETGLVASLNRPGGNITGTFFFSQLLETKRLELLHDLVPAATPIGYFYNPISLVDPAATTAVEMAARSLGVELVSLPTSTPSAIDLGFATLARQRAGALLAGSAPLFFDQREQLVALAARHAIPAIYHDRQHVEAGGLMSYGANIPDGYRLVGLYTGRILKGEKPGELPVQQSVKVELVINLKTARALGLTVPLALRGRAEEVIE